MVLGFFAGFFGAHVVARVLRAMAAHTQRIDLAAVGGRRGRRRGYGIASEVDVLGEGL